MVDSPSASAPSIRARWEIDLSPGGRIVPLSGPERTARRGCLLIFRRHIWLALRRRCWPSGGRRSDSIAGHGPSSGGAVTRFAFDSTRSLGLREAPSTLPTRDRSGETRTRHQARLPELRHQILRPQSRPDRLSRNAARCSRSSSWRGRAPAAARREPVGQSTRKRSRRSTKRPNGAAGGGRRGGRRHRRGGVDTDDDDEEIEADDADDTFLEEDEEDERRRRRHHRRRRRRGGALSGLDLAGGAPY